MNKSFKELRTDVKMTDHEAETISIPANILECNVCYEIPSQNTLVFCSNDHIACNRCRSRMTNCGLCRGSFQDDKPLSNMLKNIMSSVQVRCKYKSNGCNEKLMLNDRESHEINCNFRVCKYYDAGCNIRISSSGEWPFHEERCEYRQIDCYVGMCQTQGGVRINLGPMVNQLFNHENSIHSQAGGARRVTVEDIQSFELSGPVDSALKGTFFIENSGKVHYIFVLNFGVHGLTGHDKACLISTMTPTEVSKLRCIISLKYEGTNMNTYAGKVFSIDDTRDIHSMFSGGLLLPRGLKEQFTSGNLTLSIKIFED